MDVSKCSQHITSCDKQNHCSNYCYRVLELYSGIGGMRYALEASEFLFDVVAAVDMNPVVNEIYQHNFGTKGHYQRNLKSFTVKEIDDMKIDIITMSPPCQPFTRVGLKKDIDDARSDSFLHIMKILVQLQRKPSYIILENVKGFEDSEARNVLIQTLEQCNYRYQEFLLSPISFGVPNSRLRYYMIAKLETQPITTTNVKIFNIIPHSNYNWKSHCLKCIHGTNNMCSLKHHLEENSPDYFKPYLIPDHVLLKHWTVLDIVDETSNTCCCFTKAYSHYAQGTGSVFVPITDSSKVTEIFKQVASIDDNNSILELLRNLRLRYFTPKEISNIMCFPDSFNFPSSITLRQKYKSLGNSLNVFVVTCLIQSLFKDEIFHKNCDNENEASEKG